jgi:hypothetical protein
VQRILRFNQCVGFEDSDHKLFSRCDHQQTYH